MVLDVQVANAAWHGDVDAVKAWFAADPSRDMNDYATFPGTDMKYIAQLPAFVELRAMIDGVRACDGNWTSYCRLPHKEVLRLRSLVSRGRARPWGQWKRYGYAARQDGVVTFLCKLGDNGVVWKILEFWQATR